MTNSGEIDVEDADIQSGNLDAIIKILTAAGYRAWLNSMADSKFVTSTTSNSPPLTADGHSYFLLAPESEPGSHSWYYFVASFNDLRVTLSDLNEWNSHIPLVVASSNDKGEAKLAMFVLRNELTAKGFAQHLGLWSKMVEKFANEHAADPNQQLASLQKAVAELSTLLSSPDKDNLMGGSFRASDAEAIPPSILASIGAKAAAEWPTDFVMQAHVIAQQSAAYHEVPSSPPAGVPQSIFQAIRSSAATEWPNDFTMQKHVVDQQIAAYRQLHK